MNQEDFRKQIRTLMDVKGLNASQASKLQGMPCQQTLYNFLKGKSEMYTGTLERVLEALNGA